MNKTILITAAILGILSIVLGAFAAHGLKKTLPLEAITSFETGVKYQMYHAIFLLFVGSSNYVSAGYKSLIFYLVLIGVILFSGSIYGLSTSAITNVPFKKIGFLTPLGGLLLIISWIVLLINFVKFKVN